MSNNNSNYPNWLNIAKFLLNKLGERHLLLAMIVLISVFILQPNTSSTLCKASPDPLTLSRYQRQRVNRAEYHRLKIGMSLIEVQSILGRGIEVSSSSESATFKWQNKDLDESFIQALFKNSLLVSKEQSNLE